MSYLMISLLFAGLWLAGILLMVTVVFRSVASDYRGRSHSALRRYEQRPTITPSK